MRLHESMRGWSWQGSAGVAVLLLGLCLAQTVPPQTSCPAAAVPQSLTEPQYQQTEKDYTVGFMVALVQSFLNTVQPKPFPKDLILKIVQDVDQALSNQDLITEALEYERGFLVCAAIGVLYIVLMPVVGLILACCRCSDNCGGKMYQKQTSSIQCRRRTLYWTAFVTTVVILAGNICMFRSNKAIKVSVDQSQIELNKTIDNIHSFIVAVPQQVHYVVNESYRTVQEVTRNLDDIGPQLGVDIKERFRGSLDPALHSVRLLDQETVKTTVELNQLNSSLAQLQSSMDRLQANVTAVKNHIDQTLSKTSCRGCDILRSDLQKLTLDTSITTPSLDEFQSAMDEVSKTNLKSKIKEAEDYFDNIPQRVTNDTKEIVESSKQLLDNIKTQISQVTDALPLSALTNVSDILNQAQGEISKVKPEVDRAEQIIWSVCVALSCVVLLVVVCNFLGLVLGPLGLTHKVEPTERSLTADCGGTFLIMGASISFLFSWLFMVAVLLLFLLGGNAYTLLCRPWSNGQLLKFIDTPGLIPGLEIGPSLGLKTNITISDIYRDCGENQSLWTTLHLYELIDLDDLLNVSKYTEDIHKQFDNIDITLSTINLLSPEDKNQLRSFSNKASNFDFTGITQQINNISSINLNTTADELDMLAGAQPDNDIQRELQNEARDLRQIQADIETTIIPQQVNLNSTVKSLELKAEKIPGTVGEVLNSVEAAQDFLNTNTTQIVKTESRKFLDCQLGYFITYAEWANITITQQVGRCGPVAGAVDSAEIILCWHIVESLNAFWFSLGWCLILFIPSIIISIKLAKYYRKMKFSDFYDDNITLNVFLPPHMKPV